MAFEQIVRNTHFSGRSPLESEVRASIAGKMLFVTVASDISDQIGNPPLARVLIGSGPDAGKIAVIPTFKRMKGAVNFKLKSPAAKSKTFAVTATLVGIGLEKLRSTSVPFSVENGQLVLDLSAIQGRAAVRMAA